MTQDQDAIARIKFELDGQSPCRLVIMSRADVEDILARLETAETEEEG